jgi:galactofuranose transport system substrate-binding protein
MHDTKPATQPDQDEEVLEVKKFLSTITIVGAAALVLSGCAGPGAGAGGGDDDLITVGFAQTGSESGWRSANTESMQTAFSEENGFKLVFNAADNKIEAQIAAVRGFITQGVDAIVIAPIVEDGWDDVLQEAKDAGIPVILEDRTLTASEDLYEGWVGLDFKKEGVTAGTWAASTFTEPTNMVVLEGTTGSAPANDRAEGFDEAIAGSSITKIDSQTGNFTRAEGKTVMEGFLQKYGKDGIDLVYAHNDDMALGAIDAIEAAGLVPGVDIKIVSIDAVHDGMQALADGKINYIVECNPLLGELAAGLVKDVLDGKTIERATFVEDGQFDQEAAIAALPDRKY